MNGRLSWSDDDGGVWPLIHQSQLVEIHTGQAPTFVQRARTDLFTG